MPDDDPIQNYMSPDWHAHPDCPLCSPDRIATAAALCNDIQYVLQGISSGKIRSDAGTMHYLVGLAAGIAVAANLKIGATPEEWRQHSDFHVNNLVRIAELVHAIRTGRVKKPRCQVIICDAVPSDPDLTIPEELKWKPG